VAKGPEAFRSISEAADALGVAQHVLRFWETRFSFIRPMKRAGGRRYYRPADIAVLAEIRRLLHDEGYTIKGVQKLHRELGARRFASGSEADGDVAAPRESARSDGGPEFPGAARARLEATLASLEAAKLRLDKLLALTEGNAGSA
jgi:DNA-binding transcriptional MerR regulator